MNLSSESEKLRNPFLKLNLQKQASNDLHSVYSTHKEPFAQIHGQETPGLFALGNAQGDSFSSPAKYFSVNKFSGDFCLGLQLESNKARAKSPVFCLEVSANESKAVNKMEKGNFSLSTFSESPSFNKRAREAALCYQAKSLKCLKGLYNLLGKYYMDSPINSNDLKTTEFELDLFGLTLHRRFVLPNQTRKPNTNAITTREELLSLIKESRDALSKKRVEENIKFVFKHGIKCLKEKFKASIGHDENCERAFFKHYFSKICPNEDFSEIREPLAKKRRGQKVKVKTLNRRYLRRVFCNSQFREDFIACLISPGFIGDHQREVLKKVHNCLKGIEKRFGLKTEISKQVYPKLADYVGKNKFFKLPWLKREVEAATEFFLDLIKELSYA